jgi:hypothetical protein
VLPVPLIALPVTVREHPWWLAAAAHEVGHQLASTLAGGRLLTQLQGHLAALPADGPLGDGPGSPWPGWRAELLADACAVLMVGPAACVTTVQFLRRTDAAQLAESNDYPSLFVRRRVMHDLLAAVGCPAAGGVPADDDAQPLEALQLDGVPGTVAAVEHLRARAGHRLKAVPAVTRAVAGLSLGGVALPQLCGWEAGRFAPGGPAGHWCDALLDPHRQPAPESEPYTARTVAAGAVAAWRHVAAIDHARARADARTRLAERIRWLLPRCRPEGHRAGDDAGVDVTAATVALTGVLFGDAVAAS